MIQYNAAVRFMDLANSTILRYDYSTEFQHCNALYCNACNALP